MDLSSGVFTVPIPGLYHFEFVGLKDAVADFSIFLQVNGVNVGFAYSYHSQNKGWDRIFLSSSLRLKSNDPVCMYYENSKGALFDRKDGNFTQFSGWLVEEELM